MWYGVDWNRPLPYTHEDNCVEFPETLCLQCYQGKGAKVCVLTLSHVRCTNLHDNPPNLELCFSRTFSILNSIDGIFHAILPVIRIKPQGNPKTF